MKPWLTAAVVIVVVALLAGTSLLLLKTPPQASETHSSSTSTSASNGLELRLAINATNLAPGGKLGVTVSEFNTEATANNVSAAQLWKVQGLSLGACGTEIYPFGIAVFQGGYTSENVSEAKPLRIFPPIACPMMIRLVTGYLFEPMSDSAVVLPGASPTPMSANLTVRGQYADSSLMKLSPGVYTVVAGDEWGALLTLQFSVGGHAQTSTTAGGNGTLDAQLSVGPTAPVCRANASVGPAPSPYASISVILTPSSGSNMTLPVSWLSNECEVWGSLQTSLAPGSYQLNLSSCTFMGCASTLPKSFVVVSGQTTSLTVSIDTGMR